MDSIFCAMFIVSNLAPVHSEISFLWKISCLLCFLVHPLVCMLMKATQQVDKEGSKEYENSNWCSEMCFESLTYEMIMLSVI